MRTTVLIDRCAEYARRFEAKFNKSSVPVDIRQLAHELGVERITGRPLPVDGYLGADDGGKLSICYNSCMSNHRIRFTIAHEIGHILFSRMRGQPLEDRVFRSWRRDGTEERAANRMAAELLMPAKYISGALRQDQASWGSLLQLARELNVSLSAMSYRVQEVPGIIACMCAVDPTATVSELENTSFWISRHVGGRLVFRKRDVLKDVIGRSRRGVNRHTVLVQVENGVSGVPCEGNLKTVAGRSRYCLIGWTSDEN